MNTRFIPYATAGALLLAVGGLHAQPNLREILKDTAVGAHWIYDDFAKGITDAKATSKPLLVTFRCVP